MNFVVVLKAIIGLLMIFFIPGYVTFIAFKAKQIANLELSFFETLLLQVLISTIVTGSCAFALAILGHFFFWNLMGLLLVYSTIVLVIAIKRRVRLIFLAFPSPRPAKESLFLIFIVLWAVSLFFHPFEFDLFHFREAGENINMGITLAKYGTFHIEDPLFGSIPPKYKSIFYDKIGDDTFSLFPTYSFIIQNGIIKPTYYRFYPVWIGIFYLIFGLSGTLFINSFFMILSLFVFYFLVLRLFGRQTAILAVSLFAVSFFSIYFSWYHGNETLAEFRVLAFLLLFIYFLKSKHSLFMIFSAALLMEIVLVRIDGVILIVGLLLYLLIANGIARKKLQIFIPTLFLFSSIPVIYYYLFSRGVIRYFSVLREFILILLVFSVASLALLFLFGARRLIAFLKTNYHYFFLCVFVGFLIYGFLSYPTDREFENLHNLISFSWYVGGLGVTLFILGFIAFLRYATTEEHKFVSCLYLPSALFFFHHIHNYVLHPWCMRRYLPLVFPLLIVFLSYFVTRFFGGTKLKSNSPRFLCTGVICLLMVSFLIPTYPLLHRLHKKTEGFSVVKQLEDMQSFFQKESIVIFHIDNYELSPVMPLKLIWGKNTILMPRTIDYNPPGRARVRVLPEEAIANDQSLIGDYLEMCRIWQQHGYVVYLINPSIKFMLQILSHKNVALLRQAKFVLEFPGIPIAYDAFPFHSKMYTQELFVYKLVDRL